MKSKLFKILGVVAVVAMVAAAIVAPVSASAVSAVTVTTTTAGGIISSTGNYSIYATLATQLLGSTTVTVTLPDKGDAVKFTAVAATDKVTVTTTGAAPAVALGGTGAYASGTVSFGAIGDTVTLTSTADSTTISYTITVGNPTVATTDLSGVPTCTAAPGAFTMPDVGDSVVFTAATATDVVTLTSAALANLSVVFAPVGTATYAAGVITFSAVGQTATVTSSVSQVSGTWARTAGTATGAAGANVLAPVTTASVANGSSITVTFPAGFTVAAPTATLAASTGWVTLPPAAVPSSLAAVLTTAPIWSFNATTLTVTATLPFGDYIGATAQVLINITAGVTNPGTAGNYTLTFATSADTTAVTSAAFAISNPTPAPLPGVASVYNTASTPVLINQSNSLNTALTTAATVTGGATIKLSAGTYGSVTGDSFSGAFVTTVPITIQGTDPSAANVIIKANGAWSLTGTGAAIVIDSVTIDNKNGAFTLSSSKSATISNSMVQNGTVNIGATGTGTSYITKDTFTVKTGAVGLAVTSATTVTGSTFNVTGTGWGISAPFDVTVSGSTFTGASNTTDAYLGNGINVTGSVAVSTIGTSTFTGLTNALTVNGGTAMVNFNGNTVTNCGEAAPPAAAASPAIVVTAAAANGINIIGNTITNGTSNIITVAAGNDGNVNIYQNTFTGNAKTASNGDNTATLSLARNWWGGAANVPANVKLVVGTTAGLQFTPALGAAPSAGAFAVTGNLTAATTVGVNITGIGDGAYEVGATALAGNPVAVAIPSADTAVKYFDVYGQTVAGGNLATGATIDFYGTTAAPVTATNSAVLFYNATFGTWVNAGGVGNAFANYWEIYVGGTAGSVITAAQFNGTPFVLVTFPTVLGAPAPGAGAIFPTNGSTGVAVSGITFTWPMVAAPAGSTITYQFALAQASANTSANEFAILDYSDNTITNAEPNQEVLQYNTVYWWEVRAVTMSSTGAITLTGPWTMSMFTTMPQPPPTTTTMTAPPVTLTQTIITTMVTSPVTTFTFPTATQTSSPTIPSYLLWAVIAVGAVLVIAVIVLIVRTRRIP